MGLNKELFEAVKKGDMEEVRELLEKGAEVNAKDGNGDTPLHEAVWHNHVDVARLLIENGADVNAKNKGGYTPLHYTTFRGHVDVAELLIENGADVNAQTNDGSTPFLLAAIENKVDVARLLIENGADVNAKSNVGKTPIDIAREKGHNDIVKLLLPPLELLGFEQDGIEAGKWGRLRIKLRANKPITASVNLSGDVDWINPGVVKLSGESSIEVPVKPRTAGEIPVRIVINAEGQSISEVFWLKPLPPPPEDLEWIESRIKEVKEFVRKIEEETLV